MRVLLDTNVVSELARPRPDQQVLRSLKKIHTGALSVVSLHELYCGARRVRDQGKSKKLETWVDGMKAEYGNSIMPVTGEIAEKAATLRARSSRQGKVLHFEDALIAATAIEHELLLVTRHMQDFEVTGTHLMPI